MYFASRMARFVQGMSKVFSADALCVACHAPFIPCQGGPFQTKGVGQSHLLASFLCPTCRAHMPCKQVNVCALCGYGLPADTDASLCLSCSKKPPIWDALYFYAPYAGLCKELILQYKYSKDFAVIPLFAAMLHTGIQALPVHDVCLPMPRHTRRLRGQGFNHMVELCRAMHKLYAQPFALHALWRTRYTAPQAGLRVRQRQMNPKKSFAAQHVQGLKVLLVDDVMTTGATLHHAALTLRQAGAAHISVALLARAEK